MKAISGVLTVRFKNELERNITIKLGYANAKVRSIQTMLEPNVISIRVFCIHRSTNARTRRVQDPDVIVRTGLTKKTTQIVRDQVVGER